VSRFRTAVQGFRQGTVQPTVDELPHADTLSSIESALRELIDRIEAVARQAETEVAAARVSTSAYMTARTAWDTARSAFDELYNGAKERSSAHEAQLAELTQLEDRARQLRESVQRQKEELADLGDPCRATVQMVIRRTKTGSGRGHRLGSRRGCVAGGGGGNVRRSKIARTPSPFSWPRAKGSPGMPGGHRFAHRRRRPWSCRGRTEGRGAGLPALQSGAEAVGICPGADHAPGR
jgi:hypothetical protein